MEYDMFLQVERWFFKKVYIFSFGICEYGILNGKGEIKIVDEISVFNYLILI